LPGDFLRRKISSFVAEIFQTNQFTAWCKPSLHRLKSTTENCKQ
jgi:hypothetical protein